jgi:hypothetical protein
MKAGLIVSAILVLFFVLLLVVNLQSGGADPPTSATETTTLEPVGFADLPPVVVYDDPSGDATEHYRRALEHAIAHREALRDQEPESDAIAPIVTALLQARSLGRVEPGFLDRDVPVKLAEAPGYGDALYRLHAAAIREADRRFERGDAQGARELALAVWSFGERAFEHNQMLDPRLEGLGMMGSAGSRLYSFAPLEGVTGVGQGGTPDNLRAWSEAMDRIHRRWHDKRLIVAGARPHIGDLINITRNDRDPTFRIAGMLRLGMARFHPRHQANLTAIEATIETGLSDPNPLIRRAAEASKAMTVEEMRRIN